MRRLAAFTASVLLCAGSLWSQGVVKLVGAEGNYQLQVDGQPFFIQGAGGGASKPLLKEIGGNSFRTWGVGADTQAQLDEAQRLELKVALGIWLGHEEHHFDYNNPEQVQEQFEAAKAAVLKYKDHPALLLWSFGNEMEGYKSGDNPAIWKAVDEIAAMSKQLDPNHPTMTVIAELGGNRVSAINQYCPHIDIIGINSYAGAPSIPARYRAAGGIKPYVLTEFGPPGTWETGKNAWNVAPELTSTAKGARYRETWEKAIAAEQGKLCLGGYAFTWGNKQEATATWYGMFLADGTRLEAMDTMRELWTGKPAADRCPQVRSLKVQGPDKLAPGTAVQVKLDASDPENEPLTVKWKLDKDMSQYQSLGGESQPAPPTFPDAIVKGDATGAEVKMPADGGPYLLYAFIYDGKGGGAVANVPLFVAAEQKAAGQDAPSALYLANAPSEQKSGVAPATPLPFDLYKDGLAPLPYIPSGWIGKTDAIAMDEKSSDNPHSGATCMKCEFKSPDNFGGIIWQHPANDWGKEPGGKNLTGARKLTFWARGAKGGEKVKFVFGVIKKDQPFYDTASAEGEVTLSPDWKHYQISLDGKELQRIKTGFGWVVGGQGAPVAFYLDDIRYE